MKLFGVSNHSLTYVYRKIARWCNTSGKNVVVYDLNDNTRYDTEKLQEYVKHDILLLDYTELRSCWNFIKDSHLIVVVFGDIISLTEVSGIKLLDDEKKEVWEYIFNYKKLNLKPLWLACRTKHHVKDYNIPKVQPKHLPEFIQGLETGLILSKLLTLQYSISQSTRQKITSNFARYFRGEIDVETWQNQANDTLGKRRFGKLARDRIQDIVDCLKSKEGEVLLKALKETTNAKIKKIAKKYNIDSYELHFFYKLVTKGEEDGSAKGNPRN